MQTQRLRFTAHKVVFKTLTDLNPNFMKEIFYRFPKLTHRKDNLYVHTRNTIKFGNTQVTRGTHMKLPLLENNRVSKIVTQIQIFHEKVVHLSAIYVVN